MHRPKPGQNFVIRAGFFIIFFFTGWVTGCLFLHRDQARVQAVQKNRNPGTDPIITRLLPDCYSFLPDIYFVENFILSCTSYEVDFEFL